MSGPAYKNTDGSASHRTQSTFVKKPVKALWHFLCTLHSWTHTISPRPPPEGLCPPTSVIFLVLYSSLTSTAFSPASSFQTLSNSLRADSKATFSIEPSLERLAVQMLPCTALPQEFASHLIWCSPMACCLFSNTFLLDAQEVSWGFSKIPLTSQWNRAQFLARNQHATNLNESNYAPYTSTLRASSNCS